MLSLLQTIQKRVGKAASEIAAPSLRDLPVEHLLEPTVGWPPEDDYTLRVPQTAVVNLLPISPPRQTSPAPLSVPRTVACAFQVESVAHSLLPLLAESDTKEVRAELAASTAPNRFYRLAKPQSVSEDLNRAIIMSRSLRTEDCLALLLARFAISEDLHEPLARAARAGGKQYSEQTEKTENSLVSEKLETPPLAFGGVGLGNRKASEHSQGRVTRGMNVWDLLLALLQRPLNLDLGTVVDLPSSLWSFQTKGVEFLVEKQSALLGDDMGTGKTVQTSVALRMLFQMAKVRTALIVCPLSVVPNWDRELAKWAGNLGATVVRGDKKRRKVCWRQPAHVWLTTYDTLRNDLEHVLTVRKGGFDLMVLDEAQRVKNWSAGVTRAVRGLQANYRWGLTGTPLENNTDELWTILNVLKPDISQGPLDWSEGIRSVLRPMFLRRRKQDVLTDLPPLVQNPVWLRLEDEQRRSYDQLEKQGVLELHAKGETITAQIIIVLLNKLKQVCNRCPRSGESSKCDWLRDSLDDITAEGDKARMIGNSLFAFGSAPAWDDFRQRFIQGETPQATCLPLPEVFGHGLFAERLAEEHSREAFPSRRRMPAGSASPRPSGR